MSVIRVNKTENYTIMSNFHFKEKDMSLKAKGLLSIMLSLPKNWDYSIAGLVSICKENETAINNTLNELKKFGYLKITKEMPSKYNGGRINYIYDIFEKPQQEHKKQDLENLWVEIQGVENPVQLNTNNKTLNNNNIYIVEQVISYLNHTCNTSYRDKTPNTIKHINARLNEGYTLEDFKKVINNKYNEWKGTEWEKFLRPDTLFGTKFENYLNAKITKQQTGKEATKREYTKDEYDNMFDDINNVEI